MPLRSATVSRVLGHGFPPPLNPAVESTTCESTQRTDTDIADIAIKGTIIMSEVEKLPVGGRWGILADLLS